MIIRRAERRDIPAMLQLIQELADYEKAPLEVTVDPLHFETSGFGPQPGHKLERRQMKVEEKYP